LSPERAGIVARDPALELRRRTKTTTSATTARKKIDPTTTPAISGVLSVEVGVEVSMLVVVEDGRPAIVGVDEN
jgi:hypothetical protein